MLRKEAVIRKWEGNEKEVEYVFGVGNLTADIETRVVNAQGSEKAVVGGKGQSIACNYYEGGEKKVEFLAVEAWERTAELLGRLGKKGTEMAFVGRYLEKPYTSKDGKEGVAKTVVIEQFQLTSRMGKPADAAPKKDDAVSVNDFIPVDDEDIPF